MNVAQVEGVYFAQNSRGVTLFLWICCIKICLDLPPTDALRQSTDNNHVINYFAFD